MTHLHLGWRRTGPFCGTEHPLSAHDERLKMMGKGRGRRTCSICLPIPVFVIPRPPKICTASRAMSCDARVVNILSSAMGLQRLDCVSMRSLPAFFAYEHSPCKRLCLLLIVHVLHLVRNVFEPVLRRLSLRDHIRKL